MIRKALQEDMPEIMALIDSVFEEQQIPREWNPIPEEKLPQWWCVEENGHIAGACALFRENDQWHMGRIGIAKDRRGKHLGTELLAYALNEIFSQDIEEIELEARDTTVHILQKYGAEITGEPVFFFTDNITPLRITKQSYEDSVKH